MTRRSQAWRVGVGVAGVAILSVIAVVVVSLWIDRRHDDDHDWGNLQYCLALHRPQETVGETRAAIAGQPKSELSDLESMRARSSMFFTSGAVAGAPQTLRPDARRVIGAFRSAISGGSTAPLDDANVEASVRKLATHGDEICGNDGER